MQTRWHSFIESLQNIAIGMTIALISQLLIFPIYDIHIPLNHNVQIMLWFTGISIARSYLIRRWNNRKTMKHLERHGMSLVPNKPTAAEIPGSVDEHEFVNEREG